MTRAEMEETKISENINLNTLAITNRDLIPLPVTLVPSKHDQPHKWDGCPVLHIGNNSGWFMFTLCAKGIEKYANDSMSIWGDYCCLNFKEIIDEAVAALGWDLSYQRGA